MGICTRVISPTPSKNPLSASVVVLNERFPTQTEFCRFSFLETDKEATATPSLSFLFLAAVVESLIDFFCSRSSFFFCRRRSA
jgi:hypothetical protein